MRTALAFGLAEVLAAILAGSPARAAEESAERERFFEQKVRPLLAARCYECHGPSKQESGLRLDSRAALLKGGDSGTPAAVAGNPGDSLLVKAVRHEGDIKMPPDKQLAADEIAALTAWIQGGLAWPATANSTVPLPAVERVDVDRRQHWAYQPVARPPLPPASDPGWPLEPLDYHVLARLDAAKLAPSPTADRRTLIRRLSFDLVGLPPAPDEVEQFAADEAPDAWNRLVDRLLASPHFGERWGRHWLDVARYGDTKGYAFAKERRYPYAYTYRDYVIQAFNADLPYDRFITEQLAADLLPPSGDNHALAALGFLTTGRKFNNGQDDIDDKIDVVCRGLMGLTVGCARCHDHKYDAVPMEDYYSLYGVFASVTEPEQLPLIGSPVQNAAYAEYEQELQKLQQELENFRQAKRLEIIDSARQRVTDYLARVASTQSDDLLAKLPFLTLRRNDLRPKLVERWRGWLKANATPEHAVLGPWQALVIAPDAALADEAYVAATRGTLERLLQRPEGTEPGQLNPLIKAALVAQPITARVELARAYGKAFSETYAQWKEAGGNAEATGKLPPAAAQLIGLLTAADSPTEISAEQLKDVLNRADRNQQNEFEKKIDVFQATSPAAPPRAMIVVENPQPHTPHVFLRGNATRLGKQVPRQFPLVVAGPSRQPFQHGSGRLELAQAILSLDNPLTRRVLVNRVWMQHFGEPLVTTPSDFGVRTPQPVQRDLLEHLTASIVDRQWSLKALHRQLVLSNTYRQASHSRTDAAQVDPENQLLWRMNRRRLDFEPLRDSLLAVANNLDLAAGGKPVDLFSEKYARRRAVYGFIDRQDLPNLLRAFDFASPDQSSERRPRTTVPQQALFLMNSPLVIQQARQLAARPDVAGTADPLARIRAMYHLAFGREPRPAELELGVAFTSVPAESGASLVELTPWEQFAQLLLMSNEFAYVD